MDIKIELVAVPVSDVDRAKAFYEKVGFVVDHDHRVSDDVRFVQLTPPGSACSIAIGNGLTEMAPGSLDNMQCVVADADAAYADLRSAASSARASTSSRGAGSSTSPTPTATTGRSSRSRTTARPTAVDPGPARSVRGIRAARRRMVPVPRAVLCTPVSCWRIGTGVAAADPGRDGTT